MRFPKLSGLLLTGLIPLCLTASLTGCASKVQLTVPERDTPPENLLRACPAPEVGVLKTNTDLVLVILGLRTALASCDDDKSSLRLWAESK